MSLRQIKHVLSRQTGAVRSLVNNSPVVRGLEQIPGLYDPVCALYELFAAG